MTLMQKALGYVRRALAISDPNGWTPTDRATASGERVTADTVLGLSATYACVNLLAGTIASLPLVVYDVDAFGTRTVAKKHPLYAVLHDSPNYDQTAVDFWEFVCASLELHGNAYAAIARRDDGVVSALTPIRPDWVQTRRLESGAIEYRWTDNGRPQVATDADVLHIRGFGGGPLGGASTLAICRQAFGVALATEKTSGTAFANGARPSGTLSLDKPLDAEQRIELETLLQEKFVGAMNAGRPMLLDNGLKWEALSLPPSDMELLDSRKFSGEEICRIFGVPPAMVGFGDKASNWGTGKEQDVLGFQKFTLRRRLKRIEQALAKQLLTPAERGRGTTIEFNLEGLLRGDSNGRAAFYRQMTQIGAMTINEIRRLENLPPVDGGDVIRLQAQNVPISQADQPLLLPAPGATP